MYEWYRKLFSLKKTNIKQNNAKIKNRSSVIYNNFGLRMIC